MGRFSERVGMTWALVRGAALPLILGACGPGEATGTWRQGLGPDQQRVLGFEQPTVDWSTNAGALSASPLVTQGTTALGLMPAGWTEVTSVPLSSLGAVQSTFRLDLRAPSAVPWGEARVILIAPSRGVYWADLGGYPLVSLTAGQFTTLSFPLSVDVKNALEGAYTDLRIKVVLNGPALAAPYVFDNIVIADGGGSGGGGSGGGGSAGATSSGGGSSPPGGGGTGASAPDEISAVVPLGETRASMFLSAADYLQVDDRVELGLPGQFLNVAGLGTPGVKLGSALKGHNNTYSGGNVFIRSQAKVDGFVRAAGTIDKQDATVSVLGSEQPHRDVPPRTLRWKVTFPVNPTALNVLESGSDLFLDPGGYRDLNAHGGSVHLRTGTYYFGTFNTEPPAQVLLDNDDGPVIVYVRSAFTYKGAFVDDADHEGQLLVGYLGSSVAFLQAPFVGTLVAPNAKVELQRPTSGQHKGSWFAKELQVFSDSQILSLPFDWGSLPPQDEPPDSDGDGVIDRLDGCVHDPNKVEPLDCGCNVPETDDDDDKTPNCIDPCPTDPDNTRALSCGCLNEDNLQKAGKPCVVEACSGSRQTDVCDGQGHCGEPNCPPLPEGCTWQVHGDSSYWFCQGPVTWEAAEGFCRQEPYRYLVKVDDAAENRWLTKTLASTAWLGGNDLSERESWSWSSASRRDDQLFFQGGLPIPAQYTRWAAGAPTFGDCLKMDEDGTWADADCSASLGFVCEQPLLQLPAPIETPRFCDIFPVICEDNDDENDPTGCVENSQEFPSSGTAEQNKAEMVRIAKACTDACPTENAQPGCPDEFCKDLAAYPLPGAKRCKKFSAQAKYSCDLKSVHPDPNETCSADDPSCPAGYECGRKRECVALDANLEEKPCDDDDDCTSPQYCGTRVKVCIDPFLRSSCDTKVGDQCVGRCFGVFACGIVEPDCAADDDDVFVGDCSETVLCPEPDTTDYNTDPLSDPLSNLEPQEFPAARFFPEPKLSSTPFPDAKPPDCGGDNEPACTFELGQHPWCNYTIDPGEKPEARTVSDADEAFGDKRGTGGSSGPIRFDFDPNLILDYDIEQPLPLGDSKFRAYAEASATASAHFSLFGIDGGVTILDALGSLEVDRCGLETNARLSLFGHDFLPALLGEDVYSHLHDLDTTPEVRDTCQEAIDTIQTVVSRAQKALRDAQELIRQQKSLLDLGKRFSPTLCDELLSRGVPENFPTAEAPFKSCADLTPEDTINLFIGYYEQQINELISTQSGLLLPASKGGSLPDFTALEIPFLDVGSNAQNDTLDDSRRETQQITNISFPIGPVPVNLTIEAFAQYGIAGSLSFKFNPGGLLAVYASDGRPLNEKSQELAYVDATVTPFAGAGVSMFVGVGFDFGGLSAKIGVSGDVSLGNVSLPIYARAGLKVVPEQDGRPLPIDLASMTNAADMLFPPAPPLKYRYDAFYKFGANVSISDILKGSIAAKLKISFLWFSKTWSKTIATFDSPFDPIIIELINGGAGKPFAESHGQMGTVRQPVPFVKLTTVEPPPPLPPLDDGTGGVGGGGGTGGSATGGTGPRVSLFVDGDPRYVGFNPSRVGNLFYDGYCQCSGLEAACTSDLGCCDGAKCIKDDNLSPPSGGKCLACIPPPSMFFSGVCGQSSDCCESGDPQKPNICFPSSSTALERKYCRQCSGNGDPFWDLDGDHLPDYDECCPNTQPFVSPTTGATTCLTCNPTGGECTTAEHCCDVPGKRTFCNANNKCDFTVAPPT